MHGTIGRKGEMLVMDVTGHTKIEWDRDIEDSVATARDAFDAAMDRGCSAFRVTGAGERGERVTTFDPRAEKYIIAAPLRGG
jgi:hypothetical protein